MGNPNGGSEKPSFWNSLPGLITAIAALITAVGGLVTFYYSRPRKVQPQEIVAAANTPAPGLRRPRPVSPKDQTENARIVKPAAEIPVREGRYELQEINGAPQKRGIIMQLSKVTDDYFLADATTPTPYSWTGKLLRKGDGWDLVIVSRSGPVIPQVGTAFNPGSGFSRVERQGPLVTFHGGNGTFVWRMVEPVGN